jgi:two-component sensor histidine kinase
LILVVVSYGYFLIGFALWRRGAEIPEVTKLIIGISLLFTALGAISILKKFGVLLMISSFAAMTLYLVIDPFVTVAWIQLSVLVAIITLAVAFSHQGRYLSWTISALVALSLFNFLSYYFEATSLLRSGSFMARGAISSTMIISTSIYSLYGWRRMMDRVRGNQSQTQALLSQIESMENARASQKTWRELVIGVHEGTLNTIRSLLTIRYTNAEELRAAVDRSLNRDRATISQAREQRTGSVIGSIRAGIDGAALEAKVKISSQGVNLQLAPEVARTVERVVREALRNAIDHAQAKSIEIAWRTTTEAGLVAGEQERGSLSLTISDDGRSDSPNRAAGIGTTFIMTKAIKDFGGSISFESREASGALGTIVRLELPTTALNRSVASQELRSFSASDLGRYMALLTLFGPAMTGVIFFPLLGIWWPGQFLTQIFGFASLLYILFVTFIRERRLGWIESALASIALLFVIQFLNLGSLDCVSSQPFQWVINSVVYGLFIIFLWGKWQVALIGYPVFLYLITPLHALVPQSCNYVINFALLNTLFSFLFVALIFALVYKTFEQVESFRESRIKKSDNLQSEIQENSRSIDRILDLDARAQLKIRALSESEVPLSKENENSLRMVESELRAEIQANPADSGGLTLLARDFVSESLAEGRWIDVRSIHGDSEHVQTPSEISRGFLAIASEVVSGSSIQVVVNEVYVELLLHCLSPVPESVKKFASIVDELEIPEFSCVVNSAGDDEFTLLLRREKRSR